MNSERAWLKQVRGLCAYEGYLNRFHALSACSGILINKIESGAAQDLMILHLRSPVIL